MISCLHNILKNCEPVTVRNFTESEADKYIQINSKLSFSEIKNLNPYLLSHACHVDGTEEYSSRVDGLVMEFISTNLDGLKSDLKFLVQYFLKNHVLKCWQFAYCASRDKHWMRMS